MKFFTSLVIYLCGALSAIATENEQCNLFYTNNLLKPSSGLSPLWAQEFTGSDLVREKLESLLVKNKIVIPNNLFDVWDIQAQKHGEKVSSLIAGPFTVSLIPLAVSKEFVNLSKSYDFPNPFRPQINIVGHEEVAHECLNGERCPLYINNSLNWHGSEEVAAFFKRLYDEKKVIVITSADNEGEPVDPSKRKSALENKSIIVGNLGWSGIPHITSNFSPEVTISAPADIFINSFDFAGTPILFSGTSAAAPQVTGALATFTLLTGAQLSIENAKRLLEKTSLKILPGNMYSGANMLNSYMISEVAQRISGKCSKIKNLLSKKICLSQEIFNDKNYLFPQLWNLLAKDLALAFPACSAIKLESTGTTPYSCNQKISALKKLREMALLTSNPKAWKFLSCISKTEGYDLNSYFYERLGKREELSFENLLDENVSLSNERYVIRLIQYSKDKVKYSSYIEKIVEKGSADLEVIKYILSEEEFNNLEWLKSIVNRLPPSFIEVNADILMELNKQIIENKSWQSLFLSHFGKQLNSYSELKQNLKL